MAVATVSGRSYYHITKALKSMEVGYDSLSPEQAAASDAKIVITTRAEADRVGHKKNVILDSELDAPAVAKAKILRGIHGAPVDDQLVIGMDPGNRIGISAIYMHEEIASMVESSPQAAVEQVAALLGGIASRRKVVKIGDGKIMMAKQIAWALKKKFHDGVEVEIVNEYGTSQNAEANRRGARDRSSARTIAFRTGRPFSIGKSR
ncbi:hypothetical protein [Nitrososphaera sp.]|uniref:hypothetical protein n=1 Tax=Nitrososphaera sp. TaxID=1971748 RepID=UPI00307E911F